MLDLEALDRKELQVLAKKAGIKANAGNDELRRQLASVDGLEDLVLGSRDDGTKPCMGERSSSEEGEDEGLDMLPRKKLQELAKAAGIKANLPTAKLIAELKKKELESKVFCPGEGQEAEEGRMRKEEKEHQELIQEEFEIMKLEKEQQETEQDEIAVADMPLSPEAGATRMSLKSEASFSLLGESPALSVGEMSRQVRRIEVNHDEDEEEKMGQDDQGEEQEEVEEVEEVAAEPIASSVDDAPSGALQSNILDRVSQMRMLLTKKVPSNAPAPPHQPSSAKMSSPVASSLSSRLPCTPPAAAVHRHTATSSDIKTSREVPSRHPVSAAGNFSSPAGTPSRRVSSGHTPSLRLSLHETLAGHGSILTPKRRPVPSPGSSHKKRRMMSIERQSMGSVADDDAACLMEEDELDDALSLSNLNPIDAPRMILGTRPANPALAKAPLSPPTPPAPAQLIPAPSNHDSVPRTVVGNAVGNCAPANSSGSAAQLLARLKSIKQTFNQVPSSASGPRTPAKTSGGERGGLVRTPAKVATPGIKGGSDSQDCEMELLMGISDLPITP